MRNLALLFITATIALPAAPALAGSADWAPMLAQAAGEYGQRGSQPQDAGERDRVWRGEDGRYYCRRPNGTTGMVIGGAAGALLGRELDRGQNRTLGTVLGAAGGALLGREVERGRARCQ